MPILQDADLLRQFLAQRDAACPRCGYNLRALTGQSYPECGELLELRVGLVHHKPAAMFTGLVGLAAAAGFNGLLLLFIAIMFLFEGPRGPDVLFYVYGVTMLTGEALSIVIWLKLWWSIQKCSFVRQWALAGLCWLLPLLTVLLFVVVFRYT